MRHRPFGAILAMAASLACALPAHADWAAKDGNQQPITLKGLIINGVHIPYQTLCVQNAGACVPVAGDSGGNVGVNVVGSALPAGAATSSNQTSANTKLDTLHTDLAGAATAANQASANAKLDTLHSDLAGAATAANQASANAKLDTLHSDLSGAATAANQTTANGKLDTLHADLAAGAAFNPTGSATLSLSTGSTRVALPSADKTAVIRNTGTQDANILFGGSSVTATTSGVLLPAGQAEAFNVGSAGYIAGVTASGATTLAISTGTGVPALTGGGGTTTTTNTSVTVGPIAITGVDSGTTTATGQAGASVVSGNPTAGAFALFNLSGQTSGTLTATAGFTATSLILGSYDNGATFVPVTATVAGTSQQTTTITGPGSFNVSLANLTQLMVMASDFTTGPENITLTYSRSSGPTTVLGGVQLVDSTGAGASNTTYHAINVVCLNNTCTGGGGGGSNASVGLNGQASPSSSALTGYSNGSGATVQDSASNPHPVYDAQAHADASQPIPAGANAIGTVALNAAVPAGTNDIGKVEGGETQGSAVSGGVFRHGGRAATTIPTAVSDGQAVDQMMTPDGKVVVVPYAPDALRLRGYASTTGSSAVTLLAAQGASVKTYVDALQCYNTSATTVTVTLNDSVGSTFIIPGGVNGGGNNISFPIPLSTAANTALTYTPSGSVTTLGCSFQGHQGS